MEARNALIRSNSSLDHRPESHGGAVRIAANPVNRDYNLSRSVINGLCRRTFRQQADDQIAPLCDIVLTDRRRIVQRKISRTGCDRWIYINPIVSKSV